jgi:predicted MFS family arabinose efflux permease
MFNWGLRKLMSSAAYAVHIGLSEDQGALILGLSNASSFVGRILLGIIADHISNTKTLLFCSWGCVISIMVFWTFAKSFGMLALMGTTFCLFIGKCIGVCAESVVCCLTPPASLTTPANTILQQT